MSENNKKRRILGLRDSRIVREDGTEWPLGEVGEMESRPGEVRALGPWWGSASGKLNPKAEAWLRYQLLVRPWLYCPLEYRLN